MAAAKKIVSSKPSVRSLFEKQIRQTVPSESRKIKDVLIGYNEVPVGKALRNPWKYFSNEVYLPLYPEHFTIRAIDKYSTDWESPFARHVYETEATSVRLNLVYMHLWLLRFHLRRPLKE